MSILLASALVAASFDPNATPAIDRMYPRDALRDGRSAGAVVTLVVPPDRKLRSCTVGAVVGDEKLGRSMCSLIEKANPRFRPAAGPDGQPAVGVIETYISLALPETKMGRAVKEVTASPDIRLTVNRLPADAGEALDLPVTALVDESGAVTLCEHVADAPAPFGDIACQQAGGITFPPVADSGEAVSHVREVKVRFEANAGEPSSQQAG
ncbi:hypothetical protein [Altericroceibacterium xinjiangense]|uniref:hypothetical protein n=1 Tax=Altericroceibacterium xinjiangense TaxID=762261 RepID=UPI000F7E0E77|nr:hypothetical protein [Altericroceibacterium xinjiangense]